MTKAVTRTIVMMIAIAVLVSAAFAITAQDASAATKKAKGIKTITVKASYSDDNDTAVKVRLYKNGKATKKVAVLSKENGHQASFKKLAKADKWTVKVLTKVNGYHLSQKGSKKVSLTYHKMMTGTAYEMGTNIE